MGHEANNGSPRRAIAIAYAAATTQAATPSSGQPVTNFKRSTRLYRIAMSYNKGLDRDKDGIACEKL